MRRLLRLTGIAMKSLLKRNRGNQLLLLCVIMLMIIPTAQMIISQSAMGQVENTHKKLFGSFTDIYYDSAKSDRMELDFSNSDLQKILPGFHYQEYGVFYTVYQEELSETKMLRVGFADEKARALAEITTLKGSFPVQPGEIALTESVAMLLQKNEVGKQVEVAGLTYTISGIILDYGYLWPQGEKQNNDTIGPVNAFVSKQTASQLTKQSTLLTRQILIVRIPGISNAIENDANLLRNTNAWIEKRQKFNVPAEFVLIMLIAILASVLMIFLLIRQRLSVRISIYDDLGLCKKDIRYIIQFEMITLCIGATLIGFILGCGLSILILNLLTTYLGQPVPVDIDVIAMILAYITLLTGMILMIIHYGRAIIKHALQEDTVKISYYLPGTKIIVPARLINHQNKRSMIVLTSLVMLTFCLLAFGLFYSRYFSRDIYEQPAGTLPKDYDFLFYARTLPAVANNSKEIPFYFTDTYEKLGCNKVFVNQVLSLPAVLTVKAYQEINKLHVLMKEKQIDRYIDAQDFLMDGKYAQLRQTGIADINYFRQQFGYQDDEILVGAEILAYPADVLQGLQDSVIEGQIDMEKISRGEEIILRVPAFTIRKIDDGITAKSSVPHDQAGALNSASFHVGDLMHLSGILTDEMINGAVLKSQSGSFTRKDVTIKIGAIIRDASGRFIRSGSSDKAFSVLTLDEVLPMYGLDATYSHISIYANQDYSGEEVSQAIASLSNQVPNMVLEDFQMEVKQYRVYQLILSIFSISLLILLAVTSLMIFSGQLLAKTQLNMKNYALLRINGYPFRQLICGWLYPLMSITGIGCLLGIPLSMLLFWNFGTQSKNEVLRQIFYYFPPIYFAYIGFGIIMIIIISAIPSVIYLMKYKDDVLHDIA